jgi:hypothetical protein
MQITRDLIASVKGPGWKHGLSRLLLDDEGNGAIFVVGSELPLAEFTVTLLRTRDGTGETAEGEEVTWRARGSSCQYKYAKCRLKTEQIQEWWETANLL